MPRLALWRTGDERLARGGPRGNGGRRASVGARDPTARWARPSADGSAGTSPSVAAATGVLCAPQAAERGGSGAPSSVDDPARPCRAVVRTVAAGCRGPDRVGHWLTYDQWSGPTFGHG